MPVGTFESMIFLFPEGWDMRSFPGGCIFVFLNFALELKHVCMDFFFLFFSKKIARDFAWKIEVYFGSSAPCVGM